MKQQEILEALEKGEEIVKIERMIFKRNKLVRGSIIEYYLIDKTIKRNQFEKIEHLLTKVNPQQGAYTHYKLSNK